MKKTLLFAALAAIAFVSCQKETVIVETSDGIPMKLVAKIPATKVGYTPDGNILKTSWDDDETISVVTLDGGEHIVTIDNFTSSGDAGRTKAVFTGTFTGGSSPATVIVIYPALTEISGTKFATATYTAQNGSPYSLLYGAEIGSEYIQAQFQELRQTSDNNASHLENFCIMTGNVDITDIKNNTLTTTLTNEMTVLKVTATFPDAAKGQTLKRVEINALTSADATTNLRLGNSWNYVNLPYYHIYCPGSGYVYYLYLATDIVIPASGQVTLYFANAKFANQVAGNKWKFMASVGAGSENYVCTRTFASDASFDRGSIYRMTASFTAAP